MEDKSRVSAPSKERLLIKVVLPKQGTERAVPAGGGPVKPFRSVDATFRHSIVTRLHAIANSIKVDSVNGYAPVRVKILKRHRPRATVQNFYSQIKPAPLSAPESLGNSLLKAATAAFI